MNKFLSFGFLALSIFPLSIAMEAESELSLCNEELKQSSIWAALPQEMELAIFSFLPKAESMKEIFASFAKLALTNKQWADLAQDRILIKQVAQRYLRLQKEKALEEFDAAIKEGNSKVINALLEGGIAKERENLVSESLKAAIKLGIFPSVKLLIDRGADVNVVLPTKGTYLMLAAICGHKKIVKLLVKKNVPIDSVENRGISSLMFAAHSGHKDIVAFLAAKGANLSTVSYRGDTALMFAALAGHKEVVEFLIGKGANIHTTSHDGRTALMFAAMTGRQDIIELLIALGANVNAVANGGWTALSLAVANNHLKVAEILRRSAC